MKKTIISLLSGAAMLAAVTSTYGQGQIQFQNSTATSPLVYGAGAPVGAPTPGAGVYNTTANTYTYGLYIGNSSAISLSQMTLIDTVGNATASFLAGLIPGGTVSGAGNVGAANGFGGLVAGTTYDFLVAAWSTAGGATYTAAQGSSVQGVLVGLSSLGTVVPTLVGGSSGPTQLFGTSPGQIGGFSIVPVPEPSTIVLGGLGAAALLAFRRRK